MKMSKLAILFGCSLLTTSSWAYSPPTVTIENIFTYFKQIGQERKIDVYKQKNYFTSDFKMIIHGKPILDNNAAALTKHFEHILQQVDTLELTVHEKICGKNYCVMRYDLVEPTKGKTHVMAIFKFRNGQCYEMNEVFHVQSPKLAIDVSK